MTNYLFYMNPGKSENGRNHLDGMDFGFISAGGGSRYRKQIAKMSIGDRIYLKHEGAVLAVGDVTGEADRVDEARLAMGTKTYKFFGLPLRGTYVSDQASDSDLAEYLRPVHWLVRRETGLKFITRVRYVQTVSVLRDIDALQLEKMFEI